MIDGKTLFEWWEECWPDLPRWGWGAQPSSTQRAFNALAGRIKAETIKELSKATYKAAIENALVASPEATYKKAIIHSAKFLGPIPMSAPMENPDHSTHHKSCALRHDGITCTCP